MSDQDAKKDRVVFRVNPSLYAAISEQASSANRSVTGEICTALDKWLYERDSMVLMKDRLMASTSAEAITVIRKATPSYLIVSGEEADTRKTNVRLKESLEADLRAAWESHKSEVGPVSLNSFLKHVVSWWLIYSYQMEQCAKALHKDFNNSIRPPARGAAIISSLTYGSLALA